VVWRLRAAPLDERIVAYGQIESPWPVPGSVLVVDDVAYFAAGRQSFADGGIFVFAVEPASGNIRWVQRLDSVPQKGFYECSALEFDNFDLLQQEADGVAMSRWVFDRATGKMSIDAGNPFARLNTGGGSVMFPRGSWSYAPRHQARVSPHLPRRPLVVFRDNVLYGCTQDMRGVYRREFQLEGGETFDTKWITGWAESEAVRAGQKPWLSQRLAEKATWQTSLDPAAAKTQTIEALALAGDRLYLATSAGQLSVLATRSGQLVTERKLSKPVWDGIAIAGQRLFLSAADGRLLCLGAK
jgi:outer membrane protein assembly factor BamB